MEINGYKLIDELKSDNSGYAKWGFATKKKKTYFIKEFLSPVYPVDDTELSADIISSKRAVCAEFEAQKNALYEKLEECNTGNIIIVEDFFRFGNKYYAVTEKVEHDSIDVEYISQKFNAFQKELLVKVLSYNLSCLHEHGIVHGDIKPDNVLIKKTLGGYTAKLIDFDSSYLETNPPSFEELQGDMVYFSPEAFLLIAMEEGIITHKADVFSLGLLFHQYYTGHLPAFDTSKYAYAFEAVLDEQELVIDSGIPPVIAGEISKMLNKHPARRPNLSEVFSAISGKPVVIEKPHEPDTPPQPKPEDKPTPVTNTGNNFFRKAQDDELL